MAKFKRKRKTSGRDTVHLDGSFNVAFSIKNDEIKEVKQPKLISVLRKNSNFVEIKEKKKPETKESLTQKNDEKSN
ncbi:MAG: hypothetical protein ACOC44_17100 [Promethearchaeia archaeon]